MRRILPILLLLVLNSGCALFHRQGLDPNTAAIVNGKPITRAELITRAKIYELYFKTPVESPSSDPQLINQVVTERLLLEQAAKLGVTVTDDQVEAEMVRFNDALARQYPSREEMNRQVQALGLTSNDLAAFLRDALIAQAVSDKKRAEVTITDAEVQAFYEQNRATLYTFDQDVVRAAHVLLPADQEDRARLVAAKARAGGDFGDLARTYSVDPASAEVGGDLGYFARDRMVKPFADAAFALPLGGVSDPVKTEYGWHVIKVLDKAGPGTLPYERVKDDAAHKLLPEKQETALQGWVNELERNAHIEKAPAPSK